MLFPALRLGYVVAPAHLVDAFVAAMEAKGTRQGRYFVPDRHTLYAALTLTQYEEDMAFGPQNPTSGTPRPHRVHRVQPGETLDRISALHLGDSTKWRSIAEANGIEDPLDLRPGSLLAIPGQF